MCRWGPSTAGCSTVQKSAPFFLVFLRAELCPDLLKEIFPASGRYLFGRIPGEVHVSVSFPFDGVHLGPIETLSGWPGHSFRGGPWLIPVFFILSLPEILPFCFFSWVFKYQLRFLFFPFFRNNLFGRAFAPLERAFPLAISTTLS